VQIETAAPVAKIITENQTAKGVLTEDGREFHAPTIAANIHPQLLLTKLLDRDTLDEDQRRRIDAYRSHSATFRMNVALSELPRFSSLPANEDFHFKGAIELCPSLGYMQDAYREAKDHGWTRSPIVSMQIPSTQDDTLAPPGAATWRAFSASTSSVNCRMGNQLG
jgi:phytoene dehydrogenase-like protein